MRSLLEFDRIDSASNAYADALSREGLEHPLIAAKLACGDWAVVAPVEPPVLELQYGRSMDAVRCCL